MTPGRSDTSPLQGWLNILQFVADGRQIKIPESVELELKRQSHHLPALEGVLDTSWITVDRCDDLEFVVAFARYEDLLAGPSGENRGECGVLALGETKGYEVVLDDAVPRNIAAEKGIRVTATLPLLCQAIRVGKLTVPMVSRIADDLIAGKYYLPFESGGFARWAHEEDLFGY